jgi:oxygen-dependent protoporphyrinogen oxidase
MTQQTLPHVVVGGGISGLSAANYAAEAGIETLVLEAEGRPGGCMHSVQFPEHSGYWVEAGSHSCFNSYGNLLEIMERRGLLDQVAAKEKRSYRLWRRGERRSILSALHVLELARSLPRLFSANKDGASVREYYGRGLGEKNYRDLFGPAFRSVICQPPDDFPAEALFRKKPRRKDVLRSFTMPNGLGDIPMALACSPGVELRTSAPVSSLSCNPDGYEVQDAAGNRYRCDALTLAVPPDVAGGLLKGAAPEAAAAIADIGMAEIDTQVLVFERSALEIEEIAGFISVDGAFLSAVSRDFLVDPALRGFAFHFPGGAMDEAARIEAACAALGVSPEKVRAQAFVRNRLPALRKGHPKVVEHLDQALAGGKLGITGNWFLGVSIEDCVTRSRAEHVRRFGPLAASA